MKNKFLKGMAVCGAVLMGSMMFAGCSLSNEQQKAIDLLTSKADELVSVIDKQNKQLSKTEAVEMITLGRDKINLMAGVTNMSVDINLSTGKDWVEVYYNRSIGDVFNMSGVVINNYEDGSKLSLYKETEDNGIDGSLKKYDYATQKGYNYDLNTRTLTLLQEEDFKFSQYANYDVLFQCGIEEKVTADMIYDIKSTDNGYIFTLSTERTVNEDETQFDNIITNVVIEVNDGKITSAFGEMMYISYLLDDVFSKDENGNYNTKNTYHHENPIKVNAACIDVNYKYDEDVDQTEINSIYLLAQTKYNQLYPAS